MVTLTRTLLFQNQDEPLANNTTEEEIVIGKQLSRFDSKASSIPFANSSCGTIYRAPSLASNCSQAVLSGKNSRGPSRSRRRRRRGAMGRMSSSEPQLLVKRLSIVLDTDIDIIGGRRYPGTSRRFFYGRCPRDLLITVQDLKAFLTGFLLFIVNLGNVHIGVFNRDLLGPKKREIMDLKNSKDTKLY